MMPGIPGTEGHNPDSSLGVGTRHCPCCRTSGHPSWAPSHSNLSLVPEPAFDDCLPGPLWELMLELQELWVPRLMACPSPIFSGH